MSAASQIGRFRTLLLGCVAFTAIADRDYGSFGFPYPPDARPSGCRRYEQEVNYDGTAPGFSDSSDSVSIVMPYLREKWDHLRPTVLSLLHFTPQALLKEIVLVSDGNPSELTFEDDLKAMSDKIVVLKNNRRQGLIRAKMKAVKYATGDVLVFMEAHCVVNRGWLQPMLKLLKDEPEVLVQPSLDVIPQNDFSQYQTGLNGVWRFEWNLNLVFVPGEQAGLEPDEPYPSPATSGGIFAIRSAFWRKLQFYDPEMLEWGGDHVEATMKIWRCGGRVYIHPCSRVGHLFRDPEHRPYGVDVPTVVHNYNRLAQVWMDEYKDKFYIVKPDARQMKLGDISGQVQLRNQLDCKSMAWYLEHVDPEMDWEKDYVCIPNGSKEVHGCEKAQAHGRSTLDRTMPRAELAERRAAVVQEWRLKREEPPPDDDEL